MKRTNVYLSDKQRERLQVRAEKEGVAQAELVRRAIDAYLAWDDPTYTGGSLSSRRVNADGSSRSL